MLCVSKTAKMLLQRKSLAFIAPSGEKYLVLCFSKCVNEQTVISAAKHYQNFLIRALPRRKKLH